MTEGSTRRDGIEGELVAKRMKEAENMERKKEGKLPRDAKMESEEEGDGVEGRRWNQRRRTMGRKGGEKIGRR